MLVGVVFNREIESLKMRITVRNLPVTTTQEDISREFSKHGKITDICMLKDDSGGFRRICFIGYLEEKAAVRAVEYYDGSFFRNQRISCEVAKKGERRINESEERMIRYSKQLFVKGIPCDITEDALRRIFEKYGEIDNIETLDIRNGRNAHVLFRDGECAVEAYRDVRLIGGMRTRISAWRKKVSQGSCERYNSLFFNFESVIKRTCENENIDVRDLVNIKDKDLGARIALMETHLVQQTKEFLENNGIYLNRLTGETDKKTLILRNMELMKCLDLVKESCRVEIAPSRCLALLKFRGEREALECYKKMNLKRMKEHVVYCEYAPICKAPEESEIKPLNQTSKDKKNNKLLVRNVPFQASEEEIRKIFGSYVHVVDVRIPVKREGSMRGFCFVTLNSADDVSNAIEYFGNSTHLYGRRLVLDRAKS